MTPKIKITLRLSEVRARLNPSLTVSSSRSGAQAAFGEGFACKHAMDVVIEIK